jgi:hypothetical protein
VEAYLLPHALCGYMKEQTNDLDIQVIRPGVEPG